ncbi:MAG: DNA recombination protein RmuC [Cyanobacteria bacterium REEB446]|nr:DNA recombination protein RmuC [Cyanobacteria bacterium REEB446]
MTIDFIILIFSFVSIILSIYVLVELSRFSNGFSFNHHQLSLFQEGLENRFRSLDSGSRQDFQALKFTLESRLIAMQEDNNLKLEQMRLTVDERLQGTLDKRLGESFKRVDERLEQVYKGLGEMQNLAVGVGDLKRLLNNVKTRGVWGEIQLGSLLEQILAPEQFEKNVKVRPKSTEIVDFAIKFPGQGDSPEPLWLPLDAKFPQEDYLRLIEAGEQGDLIASDKALKQLETRIKAEARSIRDKYIYPPHTTDFAILFLPIEGLYAEVARRPELLEILQRDCRVIVAGPSVLAALLNSLQMGFRTLAIQKHSSEVWKLLASIKKEFFNFVLLLEKTEKKLDEASQSIKDVSDKSLRIGTKLKRVDLPQSESVDLEPQEV